MMTLTQEQQWICIKTLQYALDDLLEAISTFVEVAFYTLPHQQEMLLIPIRTSETETVRIIVNKDNGYQYQYQNLEILNDPSVYTSLLLAIEIAKRAKWNPIHIVMAIEDIQNATLQVQKRAQTVIEEKEKYYEDTEPIRQALEDYIKKHK